MTSLKSLLAAATPLPWEHGSPTYGVTDEYVIHTQDYVIAEMFALAGEPPNKADAALICRLRNAADAMQEYMKWEHHKFCRSLTSELKCNCGYSALAKALGVSE